MIYLYPNYQSPAAAKGATPAQWGLIERLAGAIAAPAGRTVSDVLTEDFGATGGADLTRKGASALIDLLKAAQPAPEGYRWGKQAGEWVAVGPFAEAGETISIRKLSGDTAEAVVTGSWGNDGPTHYLTVRKVGDGASRASREVPEGFYLDGTTILKVQANRAGTGRYVKALEIPADGGRGTWEFLPGGMGRASRAEPLTVEQAAAYGHRTGV